MGIFRFPLSINCWIPKILGFLFSTKKSLTCGFKCEKLNVRKSYGSYVSKIVHEWNCHRQIFGRPQVTENPASLRLKCKFTTLLCAPPQIFVVAERTRSYLAISPTYSGVITSNTQNKPKVTYLRAESLAVPRHKLWLSFTSQITFGRSGQSRANVSIQSLIWSDGSLLRRFKPWASQK